MRTTRPAHERVVLARAACEAADRPFVHELRNGMVGQAPLFRAPLDGGRHAEALEAIRIRHRGPAPTAVVQPRAGGPAFAS